MKIKVGEEWLKVYENLGYNHDLGKYGKVVMIDGEEKIVTSFSPRGPWQPHKPILDITALQERLNRQKNDNK